MIVVAGAIQIGGHGADGVKAILLTIGLAHLDARNFRQSVSIIGWFQRPGEQILFLDGLWAQFRINARRAEKQQLFTAVAVGTVNDIVLDLQILVNEFCRICGIGVDAPHLGGSQNHHIWTIFGKKSTHGGLIAQIQIRMGTRELPRIARTRQRATQSTAHKPTMACYIDQSILAHGPTRCG